MNEKMLDISDRVLLIKTAYEKAWVASEELDMQFFALLDAEHLYKSRRCGLAWHGIVQDYLEQIGEMLDILLNFVDEEMIKIKSPGNAATLPE